MTPPSPRETTDFIPAAALGLLPFDAALFVVSNFLAEAQLAGSEQNRARQQKCYAAAEACAFQTGYTELVQLVWSDAANVPSPRCSPAPVSAAPLK